MVFRALFQFLSFVSLSTLTLCQQCPVPTPDPSALAKALNTSTGNPSKCQSGTKFFPQIIDHSSNDTSGPNATFLQQFQVIDTYYKPGGPVFFFQGDEGPLNCLEFFAFVDYAQELNALLVGLEHRYFGASCPFGLNYTERAGWPVSSLKDLTWQNVLADAVYFLDWVKTSAYPGAGEVIAFSGSYGALLTTMMPIHYPDVFYGSINSCTPSNAIHSDPTGPYTFGFGTWANSVIYDTSIEAANKIKNAMLDFRARMAAGNFAGMQESLHLCSAPNATSQVDSITYYILFSYVRSLQQNIALQDYPLQQIINATLASNDSLSILGAAIEIFYASQDLTCVTWDIPLWTTVDPFLYIRCTYFPFPDPYSTTDSIWGPVLPTYTEPHILDPYCKAVFNISSVDGGLPQQRMLGVDPETLIQTQRLLFTAGSIDPSTFFEPAFNPSASRNGSRVLFMDGMAHTADLLKANETDSQGLTNGRAITLNTMKEWLGYQS